MNVITRISAQRRRERVNVFLNDEFWTGMTVKCLTELGLAAGDQIDPDRLSEIEEKVIADDALGYAVNSIMRRMPSDAMMRKKLRSRDYGDAVIDLVIEKCHDLYLLNDDIYADSLIIAKMAAGHGRSRIIRKLDEDGVPKRIYEPLIEEKFPEEAEFDRAIEVASERYPDGVKPWRSTSCINFLITRGYPFSVASDVAKQLAVSAVIEEFADLLEAKFHGRIADPQKAIAFLVRKGANYSEAREAVDLALNKK